MVSDTGSRLNNLMKIVEEHISSTGMCPSTPEIISVSGSSSASIRDDLQKLVNQGKLKIIYEAPKNPTIYMPEYMYQAVIRKQLEPSWVEQFKFERAKKIQAEIAENENELVKLQKIERLLYASGRLLEEAVETALQILELDNLQTPYENPESWDISFTLGSKVYISDIKGKSSWADKGDVGQLALWLQKFVDENPGVDPSQVCGLLIINHFKDLEPSKRWPEYKKNSPLSDAAERYLKLGNMRFLTTISLFNSLNSVIKKEPTVEKERANLTNLMKKEI